MFTLSIYRIQVSRICEKETEVSREDFKQKQSAIYAVPVNAPTDSHMLIVPISRTNRRPEKIDRNPPLRPNPWRNTLVPQRTGARLRAQRAGSRVWLELF